MVLWGIYGVGDILVHTKPLQILLIRVLCHKQASPLDALLLLLLYFLTATLTGGD